MSIATCLLSQQVSNIKQKEFCYRCIRRILCHDLYFNMIYICMSNSIVYCIFNELFVSLCVCLIIIWMSSKLIENPVSIYSNIAMCHPQVIQYNWVIIIPHDSNKQFYLINYCINNSNANYLHTQNQKKNSISFHRLYRFTMFIAIFIKIWRVFIGFILWSRKHQTFSSPSYINSENDWPK